MKEAGPMVARQVLASVLALLLVVPAWADPGVIGVATNSQFATISGNELVPGMAVLSSETIAVGPRGGVWIALAGGGQLHVGASSELRLSQASGKIEMDLLRGNAAFRFSEEPVDGRLADTTFRSASNQRALAVLDLLDSKSAVLAVVRGALVINMARGSQSLTLHEGENLKLALGPAGPQSRSRNGGGHSLPGILVTAFVIGGVATAMGFLLGQSENQLSATDKANAIKPFRP